MENKEQKETTNQTKQAQQTSGRSEDSNVIVLDLNEIFGPDADKIEYEFAEPKKKSNISPEEELERQLEDVELIKALDRLPPMFVDYRLLTKEDILKMRLKKHLESVIKFIMFYLRRFQDHYGVHMGYSINYDVNDQGLPRIIIEVTSFKVDEHFYERLRMSDKASSTAVSKAAKGKAEKKPDKKTS